MACQISRVACLFAHLLCDYSAQWICKCEDRCRSPTVVKSCWMSGVREYLFFFIAVRHQLHGEPQLFKMAGDLQAWT